MYVFLQNGNRMISINYSRSVLQPLLKTKKNYGTEK